MYELYYDPSIEGYDTNFWKTLSGTPTETSGNLVFNAAEAVSLKDISGGYHIFKMNVPAVDSSTDKVVGLYLPNAGFKATMEIQGNDLFFRTEGKKGAQETKIVWDTNLEGAMNDYEINLSSIEPALKINGKVKAIHSENIPKGPLSWYVKNNNSNDLKVAYLEVRNAENIS